MDRLISLITSAVIMAFSFGATVFIIGHLFDIEVMENAATYLFWLGAGVGVFYDLLYYEEKF